MIRRLGVDDSGVTVIYTLLLDAAGVLLLLVAVTAAPYVRAVWPELRETIALSGAVLGSITALVIFVRCRHR